MAAEKLYGEPATKTFALLPDPLHEKAKSLARHRGRPLAALIRDLLREAVELEDDRRSEGGLSPL